MLQQILKDMYIDPELLAELDDEQKQVLFCKLREEQVRRWKERETKLEEEEKKRQKKSKSAKPAKNGKRQVGWLLGSDQQVWCWVMGDHERDRSVDEILEDEAHEEAQRLAEQEAEELGKKAEKERQEGERKKQEEEEQQQMKLIRARHELQRKKSKEEINQLKEKRSSEIYLSYREMRQSIVKMAEEDGKNLETEWREQERKSKAAEEEIRAIARRAREEHRRSLTEPLRSSFQIIGKLSSGRGEPPSEKPPVPSNENPTEESYEVLQPGPLEKPPSLRDKVGRPPKPDSRKAIVDWFLEVEYPKGTGRSLITNQIEPWFHGIITRQDAEVLLQEEPCGTFLVRVSERIWGYAVSFRGPTRCKHFLINTAAGHYQFFGTHQIAHAKLADLVNFHRITPISNSGQEKLVRSCRQKQDPPNYQELIPATNSITL